MCEVLALASEKTPVKCEETQLSFKVDNDVS